MSWRGKGVLITGASSGIGEAAARKFVAQGATVHGLARRQERIKEIAAELTGPGELLAYGADVASGEEMLTACTEVLAEHELPDVVIANAGIGMDALFANSDDKRIEQLFQINVLGVYRTLRPFIAGMIARGSGRILLISSIVGKRGTPYYSAYSASKFALHGMADSLRSELHGSGVSVGLVCPSSTVTAFNDNKLRAGEGQKAYRPRRHSAESVADVIVSMAGSNKREVVLGFEAKLMILANTLIPGWLDGLLAKKLRGDGKG